MPTSTQQFATTTKNKDKLKPTLLRSDLSHQPLFLPHLRPPVCPFPFLFQSPPSLQGMETEILTLHLHVILAVSLEGPPGLGIIQATRCNLRPGPHDVSNWMV